MKYAYVGCRTTKERNARGNGLKTYEIDGRTGEWRELQCLAGEANPSYQTLDNDKRFLYSVHGDLTSLSSCQIREDGTLTPLNTVDLGGENPVFVTTDKSNRFLIAAALQGGFVCSLRRREDGSIGSIISRVYLEGKTKDTVSFAHQCLWDQSGTYLFVPAQGRGTGYGQVRVYRFCKEDGGLEETDCFRSREFAEPRHMAIHPNNRYAYLINEKDSSIMYFGFDEKKGTLSPRQNLSTLPDTYTGGGQASAVVIDPTGQILIGSNRIHDSLVLYRINRDTGYLTTLGFVPVLGKTPRFITFNDEGTRLYTANEDSDTIVEMKLDADRGLIEYTGRIIKTESPVCISFR